MSRLPRIVVVGSANIDLTTFTDRIPRPGETIFGRDFLMGFGGKGANQAVAARRCGAEVSMVARVGEDLFSGATIDNFSSQGIDTQFVTRTPGVSSGVAPIFVDSSGQNRILVVKGANDRLTAEDVDKAVDVIRQADFVITQLEMPLETVYYTLELARRLGVRSILNPAPGRELDFAKITNADYVVPNETETEAMTGMQMQTADDHRAGAEFLLTKGVRRAIITLGSAGSLRAAPGDLARVPPFEVQAVDTSGAGDAFIGSFACFLAEGGDELQAISQANLYAAMSTRARGTQDSFVLRQQFEEEWSARRGVTSR